MDWISYFRVLKKHKDVLERIGLEYRIPKALIMADCIRCRYLHGATVTDYINFSMYKMSSYERRRYVTTYRSFKIEKMFNVASAEERAKIGHKDIFNKTYNRFIHRNWIYAPDHTDEEIREFLKTNQEIIVKPLWQSQGIGVYKVDTTTLQGNDLEAFVHKTKQERVMLESFILQHSALSAVNPSSVNTIRVCSVRDRAGEVHIIGASLRGGGKDMVVDNFHADGVQYPVDVITGCIVRGGVRYNGEKNILYHPSTHTKMIGMQIPHWDKVIATVKEAAQIPVDMRYIGWDIAITEEGCEIIEANYGQGHNGFQQDGEGKYNTIMQYA